MFQAIGKGGANVILLSDVDQVQSADDTTAVVVIEQCGELRRFRIHALVQGSMILQRSRLFRCFTYTFRIP